MGNERRLRTSAVLAIALAALGATAMPRSAGAQAHAGHYEPADIEYGARLYSSHCVTCHGERGDSMPGASLGSGKFRRAGSDRELAAVIRDGVPGTAMVPNRYADSELTALVAYLRNMGTVDLRGIAGGDPARGRALFDGKGDCGSCHRIGGRGPRFAPDLSSIGAVRTAALLRRTLVDPTAALLPINRTVRAVLEDGTVIVGRRLNEDTFTVQLIDERERLVSIDKADVRELTASRESRMPSYAGVLDASEQADLVAYLLTLKGSN